MKEGALAITMIGKTSLLFALKIFCELIRPNDLTRAVQNTMFTN